MEDEVRKKKQQRCLIQPKTKLLRARQIREYKARIDRALELPNPVMKRAERCSISVFPFS